MAAHPSITLGDLSGTWQLNRSLSDNTEELLKLQGLSSPIRKILNYANVTLQISQYTGEDNNTHIDITQSAGAGVANSVETRTLDWTERKQKNGIWGSVRGRTRWVDLGEVSDYYLNDGWESGGWVVETEVRSEKEGWNAHVIWGFANVGGERHYVRKAVVQKGSKVVRGTFVYDRL
jgi:hypothetical protein